MQRPVRFSRMARLSMIAVGSAFAGSVLGIALEEAAVILFTAAPFGIIAIIAGIAAFIDVADSPDPPRGKYWAVAGMVLGITFCLWGVPFCSNVRFPAVRLKSANNLKDIARGLYAQAEQEKAWPAYAITDPHSRPLLSWRVALLPFVEQEALFRAFKLDEPWDGPNNIRLLAKMPRCYEAIDVPDVPQGFTFYRVFVGPGVAFERPGLLLERDYPDGLANTIMVIEAGEAVPWTKPDELAYAPNAPLPPLGGMFTHRGRLARLQGYKNGFNAAMMDGSVRWFDRNTAETTLRALITRNGGEKVELP